MTDDAQPAAAQAGQGAPLISDQCADCGATISLCDHAAARVLDPVISFHLGVEEQLRADLQQARAENARLAEGRDKMLWFIDHEIAMWSMAEVSPNLVPSMARFIVELRQLHTMLSNALATTSPTMRVAVAEPRQRYPDRCCRGKAVCDHDTEPAEEVEACWGCSCSGSPDATHECNAGDPVCRHNAPGGRWPADHQGDGSSDV